MTYRGNLQQLTSESYTRFRNKWLPYLERFTASVFNWNGQALSNTGTIRASTSLWTHCVYTDLMSTSPGGSGATLTIRDGSTLGGYQLDAANEYLYEHALVCDDWDGASDLYFTVFFEVNVDNTGGADADEVVFDVLCEYKGSGETTVKTQLVRATAVVGKSARYKMFSATATIDWDSQWYYDAGGVLRYSATNGVEASDIMSIRLNLNTTDSEVDNVVVQESVFYYLTNKPAREA